MDSFSLDQFAIFVAVVDHGGFAAAARELGRAQSAITYAIKGLEAQCGTRLFDRSAYRPRLTDAGLALLPRARRVLADVDDFRRQASGFSAGLEPGITLVADPFVPVAPVAAALGELQRDHPPVRVRFVIEAVEPALAMIKGGQADLGLLTPARALGAELASLQWIEQELVAVAAPSHPLARAPSPIAVEALRGHMQLVWTPASAPAGSHDHGVHALDRWHVTDLHAKRDMLLAGVGWGSMPQHLVAGDIAAGTLVRLELRGWEGRDRMPRFPSLIACRSDAVQGPAARLLVDALRRHAPPPPR